MSLSSVRARNAALRTAGELPGALGAAPTITHVGQVSRIPLPCIYEGNTVERCHTCNGEAKHTRECDFFDELVTRGAVGKLRSCSTCSEYIPESTKMTSEQLAARRAKKQQSGIGRESITVQPRRPSSGGIENPSTPLPQRHRKEAPRYAYGITTVPTRRDDLFPRTLSSLKGAGFPSPRIFVDGDSDTESWRREFELEVTSHYPHIKTYGNWVLALGELYIRDPWADRFCIFQDDFVTYKNLRIYLDALEMPERGYWNLYTFPKNQIKSPSESYVGWYLSNQKGLGAVALIFSRDGVTTLLSAMHMIERPKDLQRGTKAVDGGIVTAMNKAGWREYVHTPSLVQHTGFQSSMGNPKQALALSFRGENFDAADLIKEVHHVETLT